MKTIYTTIIALLISVLAYSQTPSTFKYQAVIRDANGVVLANQSVKLTVKVLPKTGAEVYSEIHEVQTNQYGLVNLEIGSKNTTKFSQINWSQGGFKLAVELGNVLIGTNDILTIPYAIHAKTAENISGGIQEKDPDFNASIAAGITASDTTAWNAASVGSYNETDPKYTAWDKNYADLINTPTTISATQASAITANSAKVGILPEEQTKLAGIQAGAQVNNIAKLTGSVAPGATDRVLNMNVGDIWLLTGNLGHHDGSDFKYTPKYAYIIFCYHHSDAPGPGYYADYIELSSDGYQISIGTDFSVTPPVVTVDLTTPATGSLPQSSTSSWAAIKLK